MAEILNEKLGIDKNEVLSQLKQDGLFQVSFGSSGSGLSYSTKLAIETAMDEAGIKGIGFTSTPGRMYPKWCFCFTIPWFDTTKREQRWYIESCRYIRS